MKDDIFQKNSRFYYSTTAHFLICCSNKIKSILPSKKIKMAAYSVKNKKCFRLHLGLRRHFKFLAWQHLFYFSISYNISKNENFSFSGCAIVKS
jgi:hypothetical protein